MPVAVAGVGAVAEDASITGSVSATDADAGETATLIYTLVNAAPTGLSFAANGSYSFDASSYDSLALGQTLVLTIPFIATDAQGAASPSADLVITVTGTNDAATDLVFSVTSVASGNNLPASEIGRVTAVDPDGGGDYAFSLASLSKLDLSGNSVTDTFPDISVTSDGRVLTSGLSGNSVYEVSVQGMQGLATTTETFSVIVGSTSFDTVQGSYTSGEDVIYGRQNADLIFAGSGNDTVFGQSGADQLSGGDGNDLLYGGSDADIFVFNTALNAATNVDQILDFASSADLLYLDDAIFLNIANSGPRLSSADFGAVSSGGDAASVGPSVNIIFDQATGNVYYDADGGNSQNRTLFADITTSGAFTFASIVVD